MPLHPDFPVVEGRCQLTENWSIELDQPHNRRLEDGSMVLWRPAFTIWLSVRGNDRKETISQRVAWIVSEASPAAFDILSGDKPGCYRHAYRLDEDGEDGPVHAYYGHLVAATGHVQIVAYFDRLEDAVLAKAIVESLRYTGSQDTSKA